MPSKLLVVDAYALLYRAHYAFGDRPLLTADGRNTSAAFGFLSTLLSALRLEQPTHVAVVFDPKGGSYRSAIYSEYKANRPPTPDGVCYGAIAMKTLLPLLGVALLEEPGYEADDLAGSLVERFANSATEVLLLSPDKDYQQLLGPFCSILKPKRTGDSFDRVTEDDLKAKYGIEEAAQFVDILALWGDAADNVPGVPGIGEKTAASLIGKYKSIDWLWGNIGSLTPKMAARLVEARDSLTLSRQLVTINREAPVPQSLEALRLGEPRWDAATACLAELEFSALAKRVVAFFSRETEAPPFAVPEGKAVAALAFSTLADTPHSYTVVTSEAQLVAMLEALASAEVIALDTETTGLATRAASLVGLSFSVAAHTGWYVPLGAMQFGAERLWEGLRGILGQGERAIVGHNLKFDMLMLRGVGFELDGTLYDTMLLHYLLAPDAPHGLDALAEEWLGYQPIAIEEVVPAIKSNPASVAQISPQLLGEYAAEDADVALRLYHALWPRVQQEGLDQLYLEMERPLLNALVDMEWQGVAVDPARLDSLREGLQTQMHELEQAIRGVAGDGQLNIDSPRQVGILLFEKLKIAAKPRKTKTGQYNTSELELRKYADVHPVVAQVLDYRERKKLLSTYVEAIPALVNPTTGRIHAHFNQAVAGTGRLSSSSPNMQNIPVRTPAGKAIRAAFVSAFEDGVLISADYSQIELRLMAHMAQDRAMIEAFRHGEDIHRSTAAKIFGVAPELVRSQEREYAKRANFGMVYGISAYGLSQQLQIGVREAEQFIREYFMLYPGVEEYMRGTIAFAQQHGYVQTLWGRKRWVPEITSPVATLRGAAERNAINAPIQGSAADIIKRAMVSICARMRSEGVRSRLILQVHDELIVDAPRRELERMRALVEEGMRGAASLRVPLVVDVAVGQHWGEL